MTTPELKNGHARNDYYLITALVKTVEGINGADKILGIRGTWRTRAACCKLTLSTP